MWLLRLNPMRANAEHNLVVARAETKEALIAFVESEMVETYIDDGQWRKVFRKGSELEWFNPPDANPWYPCLQNIGTLDDAIKDTVDSWNNMLGQIRAV